MSPTRSNARPQVSSHTDIATPTTDLGTVSVGAVTRLGHRLVTNAPITDTAVATPQVCDLVGGKRTACAVHTDVYGGCLSVRESGTVDLGVSV